MLITPISRFQIEIYPKGVIYISFPYEKGWMGVKEGLPCKRETC
jgi:hypothetical protein